MANVGSALLWNTGAYKFGNADSTSAANAGGLGDALLNQANPNAKRSNPDVLVNEENSLLNPKKQIKRRPPFDENCLLKENGLDFINTHFKKLNFKGKDYERRDLRKLIEQYREWCFIMYPTMNYKDIIKKTQSFSSKSSIKGHLQKLRDIRDGVNLEETYEDDDVDMAMNSDPQRAANGNPGGSQVGSGMNPQGPVAAPQNRLQRQPDGGNEGNGNGQRPRASDNAPKAATNQNRGNMMDFGEDPFDMIGANAMDFGGDPDEHDLARAMYG